MMFAGQRLIPGGPKEAMGNSYPLEGRKDGYASDIGMIDSWKC
jgi:hypothetical protein